ncbi:MAG: HTH domain-containing protein [Ruminococcaceae bacterium]|nr:HTH domain-containing protein [Oscillospiraceae bacterium]
MTYETPSRAAKRLGVTTRAIQKWAVEGRIPGATKMAGNWMIPADFTEPAPKGGTAPAVNIPMRQNNSLLNVEFKPGECLAYVESLTDEDEKKLAYAEYCYYRGKPEETIRIAENYIGHENPYLRTTACLMYTFANLSCGHIHMAKFSLDLLQQFFSKVDAVAKIPQIHSQKVWIGHAATTLLHLSDENVEPLEDWLRYLPGGMKMFACYIIAHKMVLENKFQGAHAVAKIVVELSPEHYTIPMIYCKIIDAVALMNLKRVEDAEKRFMVAWNLAAPDGFIEPFGEHYLMLQGIAERCLKNSQPEAYKKISDCAAVFSKHWRTLHNEMTGNNVSGDLTTTEFSIAMLYTRGWSAKEIAAHLDISVRTVYRHISNIYAVLGIRSVAELKEFVLK